MMLFAAQNKAEKPPATRVLATPTITKRHRLEVYSEWLKGLSRVTPQLHSAYRYMKKQLC
jgi:hypothetical protein